MRLYSEGELLAGFGRLQAGALVNPDTREFELIPLDAMPLAPEVEASYKSRGLKYLATFAIFDGKGRCTFEKPLDSDLVKALAGAYAQLVRTKMQERASGSTDWLKDLYNLPDNRNKEMN